MRVLFKELGSVLSFRDFVAKALGAALRVNAINSLLLLAPNLGGARLLGYREHPCIIKLNAYHHPSPEAEGGIS